MKRKIKAFTLIELMIVITILMLMSVMAYSSYNVSRQISQLKYSLKELSQSITETKNLAINGYEKENINHSIGVYFNLDDKNNYTLYSFRYDSEIELLPENILEKRKLPENIFLSSIENYENLLIYYSAIHGEASVYTFQGGRIQEITNNPEIEIEISYGNAQYYPFLRKLTYYKNTQIVDY